MKKTYILLTFITLFFMSGCTQKEEERVYFDLRSERTILIGEDYDLLEDVVVDSTYKGIVRSDGISVTSTIIEDVVGEYKATFSYTKDDGSIEYGYQTIYQMYSNFDGNNLVSNGFFDKSINYVRTMNCENNYNSLNLKHSQSYSRGIITVLTPDCEEEIRPSIGFTLHLLDLKVENKLSFRASGVGEYKLKVLLNYFDPALGELVDGFLYPAEVNVELGVFDIKDDSNGMDKFEAIINPVAAEEIFMPLLVFVLIDDDGNITSGRYFLDNVYAQETSEFNGDLS